MWHYFFKKQFISCAWVFWLYAYECFDCLCMSILNACMSMHQCMPATWKSQKRVSDSLKLESYSSAGNWTKVLCKSSKCSYPLTHISSPQIRYPFRKLSASVTEKSKWHGHKFCYWVATQPRLGIYREELNIGAHLKEGQTNGRGIFDSWVRWDVT